jgi:hypothetical protein
MSDPLEEVRLLGKALNKVAKELGLEIAALGVVPSPEPEGQDFIDVQFRITESALMNEEEKLLAAEKAVFDQLTSGLTFNDDPPVLPKDMKEKLQMLSDHSWLDEIGDDDDGSSAV